MIVPKVPSEGERDERTNHSVPAKEHEEGGDDCEEPHHDKEEVENPDAQEVDGDVVGHGGRNVVKKIKYNAMKEKGVN